jgi:hypothetical protein
MSFHTRGVMSHHGNERIWKRFSSKNRKDPTCEHWKQYVKMKNPEVWEKFAREQAEKTS